MYHSKCLSKESNHDFSELKAAVAKQRETIYVQQQKLHRLLKQCTHDEFITKSDYTIGGYDYFSETKTWDQCVLCGQRSNIVIKYGSHYE